LSEYEPFYIQTFELLTGLWAFHPESGADFELEDDHLARMIELTGELFPQPLLARAELGNEYFDDHGMCLLRVACSGRSLSCVGSLLRIDQLVPVGIEATLKDVSDLADCDINPAAEFIRACLRLDPDDRPTAAQLLEHPWMKGAEVCQNYRPPVVV
jgi:serine/threonine-protein kinase SRPK3